MIVVACYTQHYTAIPLFTHNGRGLVGKNPDEYVSVRDYRSKDHFNELSHHGTLLTKFLNEQIYLFDPKSTAHFTYPLSRRYDLPCVYEGYLEPASTRRLVKLFDEHAPKEDQLKE